MNYDEIFERMLDKESITNEEWDLFLNIYNDGNKIQIEIDME